jgi:hypothetical protein
MRVYDGDVGNKGIYNCWHNVSNEDFIGDISTLRGSVKAL